MHGHREKRTDKRYKTSTPLIVSPTFESFDYYRATELNHSNNGISFKGGFGLKPGTIILIRRENCPENCNRSKACGNCRMTSLATITWVNESKVPGVDSYSFGAKYFPYAIGY